MLLSTLKCVSHLCVYKSRPRKRPQGFRQQYSYGPPAGWPSTCSNMSRNAGRDGRTCYCKPCREGASNPAFFITQPTKGLLYIYHPQFNYSGRKSAFDTFQYKKDLYFFFFRLGLTCHLIMCVGWKVDSSNRFLVIKRYVKIFFQDSVDLPLTSFHE